MISGIYALLCPYTMRVRYIGQSKNIEKRYRQHCNDIVNTPKGNWIAKLWRDREKPALRILERTTDLDAREVYWIDEYKRRGADLLNVADGGKGMSHALRAKKKMPWSGKRAPMQTAIAAISRCASDLRRIGNTDAADSLDVMAREARKSSVRLQKMGVDRWVMANLELINRIPALQEQYLDKIDWDLAEECMGLK